MPWNGPLYEHLGFRVLDESELGPEMLSRREHDVAGGLSPKGQQALVTTLFDELRGRVKEADASVPQKDGEWLYWISFEDGAEYKIDLG